MSEIFQLVGVVVTIYFLSVRILMLYRRCSDEEAKETIASCLPKIASWFQENATGSRPTNKGNDSILDCGLIDEIWASIRLVLGESRYNQLLQLAETGTQLFSEGYHSGLHCIWLSLFHMNDSEKQRLATILTNAITQRLIPPEYDTRVKVDWTRRNDLDMAVLEIRYAKSKEQRKLLDNVIARERDKVVAMNTVVVDDTEDVDLF